MIVFLPIFVAQEEVDWKAPPLRSVLERLLTEACSLSRECRVIVATDSDEVERMAEKAGLAEVLRCEAVPVFSPRELAVSLSPGGEGGEGCIVIDYRNPFVTRSVIERAAAEYRRDAASPLVSVAVPEDHPVQLCKLCNIVSAGLIHLFDSKEDSVGGSLGFPLSGLSRPFPFNWKGILAAHPGCEAFIAGAAGDLVPFDGSGECEIIWLRDGESRARLGWTVGHDPSVVGVSVDGEVVLSAKGDGDMLLTIADMGRVQMHVMPVTSECLDQAGARSFEVPAGGVELPRPDSAVCGYAYTVEDPVVEGNFYYKQAFDPDGSLWSTVSQKANSGKELVGRQSFPDVYEIDGSVTVGTMAQLGNLTSMLANGLVRTFRLEKGGVVIRSRLDYLRYVAKEWADVCSEVSDGGGCEQ